MAGSNIASNAARIALELAIEGENEAVAALMRVNNVVNKVQQESADIQRMAVEARYDVEVEKQLNIKLAMVEADKHRVSLMTRIAMLAEAERKNSELTKTLVEPVPYGPEFTAEAQAAVAATEKAEAERVRVISAAQKEVAKIQDAELSHSQRYAIEHRRIIDLKKQGLSYQDGDVLHAANKKRYDDAVAADAAELKRVQDAADKKAAVEKAAADKAYRTWADENARRQAEMHKRFVLDPKAAEQAEIEKQQQIMKASTLAVEKEYNAERVKALNLMAGYGNASERAAADIAFFNQQLARGVITADEHTEAIGRVERRMRSMQGGAGNMGYVVGNLATGMEDFVTVLSMTGFGMDSFAAATRSASNNVGQAVRGIGTASAAIYAPLISIGTVLVGFAIPAIYRWVTAADDAASSTEKLRKEVEKLVRVFRYDFDKGLEDLDLETKLEDLFKLESTKDVTDKITEVENAITKLKLELGGEEADIAAKTEAIWRNIFINDDLDHLVNALDQVLGGDLGTMVKDRMSEIREQFDKDIKLLGGEAARQNLEHNMRVLTNSINNFYDNMSEAERTKFEAIASRGGWSRKYTGLQSNDFLNNFSSSINDVAIIDRIQAAQEQIAELDNISTEEARKKRVELEHQLAVLKSLNAQMQIAGEQEMWDTIFKDFTENQETAARTLANRINSDRELQDDIRSLQIQHKKNLMIGEEFEAERQLLDLALRRQEIMESGLAAPDVLEGMFNAELEALANNIEQKLEDIKDVTAQVDAVNQATAYTTANRLVMEVKTPDTKEKEMVELLTAIRDHLAGRNLLHVEVQ